ncbi:MAG: hypothetical protein ACK55K_07660 [Bacteroidota bacterium]
MAVNNRSPFNKLPEDDFWEIIPIGFAALTVDCATTGGIAITGAGGDGIGGKLLIGDAVICVFGTLAFVNGYGAALKACM